MARSINFIIEGEVDTKITVTELDDGTLKFDVVVLGTGSIGDLRGLFFDLNDFVADDSLSITGVDVNHTAIEEGSVDSVVKDVNLNGSVTNELGDFDVGIEFGTSGMATDDIQSTSFILSTSDLGGLSLDMLSMADFGVRYTSVGDWDGSRTSSAKIGDTSNGVAQDDVIASDENNSGSKNLLNNDATDGTSVVTSFTLNGTTYSAGSVASVVIGGLIYGSLTVAADGTATLTADGTDVDRLALDETLTFSFGYTSQATDGSEATADATATINGVNDAPTIDAGGVITGTVDEDGEDNTTIATGQLTATDIDNGSSLTWDVIGGTSLLGALTVDGNGLWTYTLDNDSAIVQSMSQSDSVEESFTVVVTDEHGAMDTQVVTVTVTGSDDGDVVVGTEGRDTFRGLPGMTAIDGLGGDDFLIGDYHYINAYNGYFNGATSNGTVGSYQYISGVTPDFGNDTINAGSGYDTVAGDAYFLYAYGDYYGDVTIQTGHDTLYGSTEGDTLMGDSYYGLAYSYNYNATLLNGNDTVLGEDGSDTVMGEGTVFYAYNVYGYGITTTATNTGGDDTVSGGADSDQVYGDAQYFYAISEDYYSYGGDQIAIAIGGNDIVSGDGGNDNVYGDAYYMQAYDYDYNYYGSSTGTSTQTAAGGNDDVSGGDGADMVYGDAYYGQAYSYNYYYSSGGDDTNLVSGGNDTVSGGDGADTLYGDFAYAYASDNSYYSGTNSNTVSGGNDVLNGGADNDTLYGDFYSAQAYNYYGVGTASVTSGNDTLNGGTGNDTLYGDFANSSNTNGTITTGADVFVFDLGSGLDRIMDYQDGQDRIDVSGYGITMFSELLGFITDDGVNTTIDFDQTVADVDEVVIYNALAGSFDSSDFIFA